MEITLVNLKTLETLVACNTVSSSNPELNSSNYHMLQLVASQLERNNFTTILYRVEENKYNLLALSPAYDNDYLYLYGHLGLLLSGHSDTVPFDESKWTSPPLKLTTRDDKAYGRGSCDMKAFIACVLNLTTELHDKHGNNYSEYPLVSILVTCDEENSMCGARDAMRLTKNVLNEHYFDELKISIPSGLNLSPLNLQTALIDKCFDLIIIGEPTLQQPVIGHKGYFAREICIKGVSTHSSNPDLGINALEFSQHVIKALSDHAEYLKQELRRDYFKVPYATLNLGYIKGGHSLNSVCDEVVIGFDMRPLPYQEEMYLNYTIKHILDTVNDQAQALFKDKLSLPSIRSKIPLAYSEVCNCYRPSFAKKELPLVDGDCKDTTGQFIYLKVPFEDIPAFINDDENSLSILKRHLDPDTTFDYVNYCTEASFLQNLGPVVIIGPGSIDQAHGVDEYVALSELAKCEDFLKSLVTDFYQHNLADLWKASLS